jgi:hypothetical protein
MKKKVEPARSTSPNSSVKFSSIVLNENLTYYQYKICRTAKQGVNDAENYYTDSIDRFGSYACPSAGD